ncbi:hypothetical protein E2C01_079079 [Portunus trituberculatus]|uniref:Uncharacterized protein n=1 Tax=Portunus trituberculatus TaxID=210409 RepID=A0A5B7IKI4_PORTR|nr:hypothetical protein [Portunus trituberculatus]
MRRCNNVPSDGAASFGSTPAQLPSPISGNSSFAQRASLCTLETPLAAERSLSLYAPVAVVVAVIYSVNPR